MWEKRYNRETHIESQRLAAILYLITVDANKSLTVLEETGLQTDDNELHAGGGVVVNVVGDTGHVGIVESSINLVEHEEGRWLVGVNGKQQSERCHGLLTTRQVLHIAESLQGRHSVVLDTVEVWLI